MSTLRLTAISNQGGTDSVPSQTVISGSAKAWVNFNGTGTVAIRAAFNVSSITDNGTGDYTVNFTNPMVDANYCFTHTAGVRNENWGLHLGNSSAPPSTTSYRFFTVTPSDIANDQNRINIAIFR